MDEKIARCIQDTALDIVGSERDRQSVKGYTWDHDDQHGSEEIATAAAFYLLPAHINPDIAFPDGHHGIKLAPLHQFIAQHTFDVDRDDSADLYGDLDKRIEMVTKGVALGLAELERLMRIREEAAD